MTTPVSVVILAAGMGTRMRSKTPKVLHRAGGLTLVEHVVRLARTVAEPENIVVVVGHGADDVRAVLARWQRFEKLYRLSIAVYCFDAYFVISWSDD